MAKVSKDKEKPVPAVRRGNGGDDGDRPRGKFLKFDAGVWTADKVTVPPGLKLIVRKTYTEINLWEDGEIVDTIGEHPLPRVADLNAQIPQSQWQKDRSGNTREPWSKAYVIEFSNPITYERFKFSSSTKGARRAFYELEDCIEERLEIEGIKADPVVGLGSLMMPTKHGKDVPRPTFIIVGWWVPGDKLQALGGPTPQLTDAHGAEPPAEEVGEYAEAPWSE